MFSNGGSTGMAPAQVSIINIDAYIQKLYFWLGVHFFVVLFFFMVGKIYKSEIDSNNAITPPNFLGIDRKIA